jgi:dTDP-4-dehydrorhamnose reductase
LPLGQPLLISGGRGTLATAFARICQLRGLPFHLLGREELDIADAGSVAAAMDRLDPWAIVNAAGYVRVDDAEHEADRCRRENVVGPATLAEACSRRGIPLVTFSTDLVFDGAVGRPYLESDTVNPLNHYGRTKVEAEAIVMGLCSQALVVRSSAFFGPWDEFNFVTLALKALGRGQSLQVTSAVVSPTYVPDLVHTCLDLLFDGATGLWHVAGAGETSWHNLATQAAGRAGLDPALLELHPTNGYTAKRPQYSALGSEKALLLPSWDHALTRYLHERLPKARYGICDTPGY